MNSRVQKVKSFIFCGKNSVGTKMAKLFFFCSQVWMLMGNEWMLWWCLNLSGDLKCKFESWLIALENHSNDSKINRCSFCQGNRFHHLSVVVIIMLSLESANRVVDKLASGDNDDRFVVDVECVVRGDAMFSSDLRKHQWQHVIRSNQLDEIRIEFLHQPLCHHAYNRI